MRIVRLRIADCRLQNVISEIRNPKLGNPKSEFRNLKSSVGMPKKSTSRTQKQLLAENEDLRARLDEAEETLRAIRAGEVDGLIVSGVGGEQVFTLKSVDHSYRMLMEDMSEGALVLTAEGVILYANRRFAEMIKTPLEKVIGSAIHTWIAPAEQKIFQALLLRDEPQTRHRGEVALLASDGTLVPGYLSTNVLQIEEMQELFCLVATDLTEQKRSEAIVASEKLAQELLAASTQSRLALLSMIEDQKRTDEALTASEAELRALFAGMTDVVIVYDADGRYIKIAPTNPINLYRPPDDMLGKTVHDILPQEQADYIVAKIGEAIQTDRVVAGEYALQIEGKEIWFTISVSRLSENTAVLVTHDITERKRAEQKIVTALEEKEILLRELYHRTKNNMQVILSMLSLEAVKSDNDELKATYQDISNRIYAMALVHQKLYQSQDLSQINLQDYLQELAQILLQNFRLSQDKIALRFEIEPVEVLIDTAMPLGLVVTELISNSLKYAFPGEMSGEINLRLFKTGQEIELHYSDNGVSVPPEFDFRHRKSYGLQSIFALVEHQLQGKVSFEGHHGLACHICFSDTLYAPRVAA
jgi:PAS domain S-box-containing protein